MWYHFHELLPPSPTHYAPPHHHHHTRPAALFWPLQVQVDPDMSSPLRKMQAVVPWASSGVAGATDAASVSHLLARWDSVNGEETLLEMLRDCVLERGMAEGDAVEVEGRVSASTRIAYLLEVLVPAPSFCALSLHWASRESS